MYEEASGNSIKIVLGFGVERSTVGIVDVAHVTSLIKEQRLQLCLNQYVINSIC